MAERFPIQNRLPQGTECIFQEEALRHTRITRKLGDLFVSWGFLPVTTPVFDYYDSYRDLMEPEAEEKSYLMMDRGGELMMLRSDVTLFLARHVGLRLKAEDLPLRICYSDTILRHENHEDPSRNEFFQTGVELIGLEGFSGDMEILLLLNNTFSLLKIPAYLHIGSHNLFSKIIRSSQPATRLKESLRQRDRAALKDELLHHYDEKEAGFYLEMLMFIGSPDQFEKLLDRTSVDLDSELEKEARYLLGIATGLLTVGLYVELRIDLSEIGIQPYHTGVGFRVFVEGSDSAVASGGRYDRLLQNFGTPAPSVGFSLLLRKLEALLPPPIDEIERLGVESLSCKDSRQQDLESFMERHRLAEDIRMNGGRASL